MVMKELPMKTPFPIKILIADDHPVVRDGLAMLINNRPDMTVVGEAANGRKAVELYSEHKPDLVLMDLRMPEMDGVDAIIAIRREYPAARIIVVTTFDTDEDIFRALQAGARGYILKDAPHEEMLACLRSVYSGKKFIPPAIAAKLSDRMNLDVLTAREIEVLRLTAEGKSNKETAEALFITEGTVKTHLNTIMRKLDAADRTQAVTIAIKRGIIRMS
jgi:two-component system, NarL family, response regulator